MPGLAFIRLSNGCSAGQVIDVCMTRSHDLERIIEIPLPGSFVFLGRCIDNLVHLGMFFEMLFKSGMAVGLDVYLRLGNSASQVGSGSTVDYVKLLGMVTQLQQHLLKAEAETSSEPKPGSAC